MKNILIHAPDTVYAIVSSYPLVCKIRDLYEDVRIHIIVHENFDQYYEFFSFNVFLHVLPDKKNTFLGIHHFAVNLHDVFNVDLYLDLKGGFLPAFLGRNFGARKRVGNASKKNKFLHTHRVEASRSSLMDRQFLELLEAVEEDKFTDFYLGLKPEVKSNITPLFKTINDKKYILMIFDDFVNMQSIWSSLFTSFEHTKFIFWDKSDSQETRDLLKGYDNERGLFEYISNASYSNLNKLIDDADAVMTNIEWIGNISSLKDKKVYLFTKDLRELKKFRHILSCGAHIEYSDDSLIKLYGNDNTFFDIRIPSEVCDYITFEVYPEDEDKGDV